MSGTSVLLLSLALIVIVVFMYFILPRISSGAPNTGVWIRLVLLLFMMIFLGFDFYQKQKYGFLIILFIGSVVFAYAILKMRKPKK